MFECLVLAIDESPAGEVGLSFATALARAHRSTVHVVHANVLLIGGRGTTAETREQSTRIVGAAVGQLNEAGVDASGEQFVATYFHVGSRIARVAEHVGADAIVLGSHRRRFFNRLLGRGVRERITRATSLPVLVAPSPLRVGRVDRRRSGGDPRPLSARGPAGFES